MAITREGRQTSKRIKFKGLPQGDALCPRVFTACLNPVAWKIRAAEGYRMSKPVNSKITGPLYIDHLKIFAGSVSKLEWVMKMVKSSMEDVGLQWNPKKCAVAHVKRSIQVTSVSGGRIVESTRKPCLDDGDGSLEYLRVLCRRISWSWSVQQKSIKDDCQLSGQVPCPIIIGW